MIAAIILIVLLCTALLSPRLDVAAVSGAVFVLVLLASLRSDKQASPRRTENRPERTPRPAPANVVSELDEMEIRQRIHDTRQEQDDLRQKAASFLDAAKIEHIKGYGWNAPAFINKANACLRQAENLNDVLPEGKRRNFRIKREN